MKIFAAGIATETNTFAAARTTLTEFCVQRGKDGVEGTVEYPSLDLSASWGRQASQRGCEFVFSLMASAEPSGPTVRSAYELLRDEILGDLRAALPVDVVLLNLHGAMIAEGYADCEKDLIGRIRAMVGRETVIGVELDLHCNLSEAKIAAADLVVLYKEYPHTDIGDRARELFDLAVDTRLGRIRPKMTLFDCRMVGLYPTSRQPMRDFVDGMLEIERGKGVLSVSLGHGFQFADVPNLGVKVLVITDDDAALGARVAGEVGLRFYGLRREVGCESYSLSIEQAFAKALANKNRPVVIADQADNPGGGAPGDSTFALRWLLDHQISDAAMAFIYDPGVVLLCHKYHGIMEGTWQAG
jgi:microcystin degradation protein MlrC